MTSIQPELWVDRAAQAVAFYQAAFGATVLYQVGDSEDIVAQLAIGDAAFWVATAGSAGPRRNPNAIGGSTSRTLLVVDEPDAVVEAALHGYPRFSWMNRGLRWMSTCTSGTSPMQVKLWISPALITRMSPAPASNSSPFTT